MADPKAPWIRGWKPQQYGGFERGNWDVDFDGEDVEASVNVSGYGGYGDRMCLPLPVLRALLSAHGLHIVSEADRKVLEALAKAVDIWLHCNPKLGTSACTKEALAAYRAATAPLRTRASVDAEIAGYVRSKTMVPLGACFFDMTKLSRLCSEPTRDEPEESHQERHERMNAAGVEKMAAILGKKTRAEWDGEPNATTDHDADLREPEACSCEKSEALRKKLSAVFSEVNACAPSIEQQHRIYELSKP